MEPHPHSQGVLITLPSFATKPAVAAITLAQDDDKAEDVGPPRQKKLTTRRTAERVEELKRRGSFLRRIRIRQKRLFSLKHDTSVIGPQGELGARADKQFRESLNDW
jgi:hypothetical protein